MNLLRIITKSVWRICSKFKAMLEKSTVSCGISSWSFIIPQAMLRFDSDAKEGRGATMTVNRDRLQISDGRTDIEWPGDGHHLTRSTSLGFKFGATTETQSSRLRIIQ